jgi:hypothetical protein
MNLATVAPPPHIKEAIEEGRGQFEVTKTIRNGVVSNQLTEWGWGGGECVGDESEPVDVNPLCTHVTV